MDTILNNPQCKWKKKTVEIMAKYSIEMWILAEDKDFVKSAIKYNVEQKFKEKMTENPENKSKIAYFLQGKKEWKPEQPAEYMKKLTRKQASTIFKARTRMTKVKDNYKNGHTDQTCRACKANPETQKHVIEECLAIHNTPKTSTINQFTEDINKLKIIAIDIDQAIEQIETPKRTAIDVTVEN